MSTIVLYEVTGTYTPFMVFVRENGNVLSSAVLSNSGDGSGFTVPAGLTYNLEVYDTSNGFWSGEFIGTTPTTSTTTTVTPTTSTTSTSTSTTTTTADPWTFMFETVPGTGGLSTVSLQSPAHSNAQRFKMVGEETTLAVEIFVDFKGSPDFDVHLIATSLDFGEPNWGTILATSQSIPASDMSPVGQKYSPKFILNYPSGFHNNLSYAISLVSSNVVTMNTANTIGWLGVGGDFYPDGKSWRSSDNGVTWVNDNHGGFNGQGDNKMSFYKPT